MRSVTAHIVSLAEESSWHHNSKLLLQAFPIGKSLFETSMCLGRILNFEALDIKRSYLYRTLTSIIKLFRIILIKLCFNVIFSVMRFPVNKNFH